MTTTRVYLLRHGETEWNRNGNRYCGRTDVPLSEYGRAQAALVATHLVSIPFDAIYASTLQRASETAEIIAGEQEASVNTDPRLVEVNFGEFEGKTPIENERDFPELWKDWRSDPASTHAGKTGESGAEAASRVSKAIDEIRRHHPGETILIVAHNTINRLWLADLLGMPIKNYQRIAQDNTGLSIADLSDHGSRLLQMNLLPGNTTSFATIP